MRVVFFVLIGISLSSIVNAQVLKIPSGIYALDKIGSLSDDTVKYSMGNVVEVSNREGGSIDIKFGVFSTNGLEYDSYFESYIAEEDYLIYVRLPDDLKVNEETNFPKNIEVIVAQYDPILNGGCYPVLLTATFKLE